MDGFCAGVGFISAGAGIAAIAGTLVITPLGASVLAISGAACLAYELW